MSVGVPHLPLPVWVRILSAVAEMHHHDDTPGDTVQLVRARCVCKSFFQACKTVFRSMQTINLCGCDNADQALAFLSAQKCRGVRAISACDSSITDHGIETILACAHWNLHVLDVERCHSVTTRTRAKLRAMCHVFTLC